MAITVLQIIYTVADLEKGLLMIFNQSHSSYYYYYLLLYYLHYYCCYCYYY